MVLGQSPRFGLRMKNFASDYFASDSNEYNIDRLHILISQEKTVYTCRDYIERRQSRRVRDKKSRHCDPLYESENYVDSTCRETMCEWSYKVCDHFNINREIVAYSIALLDRFVDNCSCDRTAFKLAAMTTLYIAIKTFDSRQVSMSSLTDLSRGEFTIEHMAEMETIILKTLKWRVNPPTVQTFIRYLLEYLPYRNSKTFQAIYNHANFFAELCLYDYALVTQNRATIAVAAIINAIEGVDGPFQSQQMHLLHVLREHYGLHIELDVLEAVRNQLWYAYEMSAQCEDDDHDHVPSYVTQEPCFVSCKRIGGISQSPVSVFVS